MAINKSNILTVRFPKDANIIVLNKKIERIANREKLTANKLIVELIKGLK